MPRYSYRAVDRLGHPDVGAIDGADEVDAFNTLQSRGLTVFELTSAEMRSQPWYARQIKLLPSRLSLGQQASVAELLSVLFLLRLPLTETLRLVETGAEDLRVRRHFARTAQRVADGALLPVAFEEAGSEFSPMFHVLLRVGEAANTLPETFAELASYLRAQDRLRSKITTALIYPSILVLAAIALVLVIAFYLAPSLEPMFVSVERPVPGGLGLFLGVRDLLTETPWLAPLAALCSGLAVLFVLKSKTGSSLLRGAMERVPVIGDIAREARLLRQIRALRMLLQSGMPLSDALALVSRFLGGADSGALDLGAAAENLRLGGRASEVIASGRRVPGIVRDLFRIGEETNRLPEILGALSRTLEERVETKMQRAVQLITPLLTLGLGMGIGFLVYSVMSAILDINELAS